MSASAFIQILDKKINYSRFLVNVDGNSNIVHDYRGFWYSCSCSPYSTDSQCGHIDALKHHLQLRNNAYDLAECHTRSQSEILIVDGGITGIALLLLEKQIQQVGDTDRSTRIICHAHRGISGKGTCRQNTISKVVDNFVSMGRSHYKLVGNGYHLAKSLPEYFWQILQAPDPKSLTQIWPRLKLDYFYFVDSKRLVLLPELKLVMEKTLQMQQPNCSWWCQVLSILLDNLSPSYQLWKQADFRGEMYGTETCEGLKG